MTVELEFRPTLLVGVGGTGSKIADRILRQVREKEQSLRPTIRMMAVDTDSGDLALLEDLAKDDRFQFSKSEYVRETLERNADIQGKWCYRNNDPQMTEIIKGKNLIEGAGQIRMLTRLALHDSTVHGDLMARMENALSRLAVHGIDDAEKSAVQIIMVGSLGGATGSGSFVQLGLMLRKAAESRNILPILRGLFLMPDVFIHSGKIDEPEWDNLLANGYASLKELNAVTLRASLRDLPNDFRFEYAPGYVAGVGDKPFDEVAFIDYENAQGGSMGKDLDAYIDMAARAMYLNVFTPMGSKIASQSINRTRAQGEALSERKINVFSSIGIAAIEYPVASTKTFLTKRLVHANLKGDWTRLDASFNDQRDRHQRDLEAGLSTGDAPNKRESYLRDFRQMAKDDPPIPFFRRAHDQIFPEIEDAANFSKSEKPLHLDFVKALLDYSKRLFWDDKEMKRVRSRSPLDAGSLLEGDGMVDTVRQEEFTLDRDFNALEANLQQRPVDIFQNAMISADGAGPGEWAAHHLQSYVIKRGLHPVAVRAFLYLAQTEMEERRDKLDPRERKRKLFLLANPFRSDEELESSGANPPTRSTPGVIEKATEAEGAGPVEKYWSKKPKNFAEDYAAYVNATLRLMRTYADEAIETKVLDQALAEVGSLVHNFEGLFAKIEKIGQSLEAEIEEDINRYENTGTTFSGASYVYANRLCKEDAWRRLNEQSGGISIDESVNSELSKEVYEKHRADRRERTDSGFDALEDRFHKSVVVGFGRDTVEKNYRDVFDFPVITAIRREYEATQREARAKGEDVTTSMEQYTKRLVERVAGHSLPYISLNRPDTDGSGVKFWAIHPDSRAAITSQSEFNDLFQSDVSGENALVEPQFSPYALICANLRVNLELQHFSKLSVAGVGADAAHPRPDGRMTVAYKAFLKRMHDTTRSSREGAEFTPHIDQSWHLPGVLPEIQAGMDEEISNQKAKSYVAMRALDLVRLEKDDTIRVARLSTHGHGIRGVDTILAQSHDPWAVQTGFFANFDAVRSTLRVWDRKLEAASEDARSHLCFKALTKPELLMTLMAPAQVRNEGVEAREQAVRGSLEAWIGLLRDVVDAQEVSATPNARDGIVISAVEDSRNALSEQVRDGGYNQAVSQAFETLFAEAHDNVFAV